MSWFKKIAGRNKKFKVGIVGFSDSVFNKKKAKEIVENAFDEIAEKKSDYDIVIVSGLTNMGIPALAYQEAKKRNWKTVGISAEEAKEYDLFPCDTVLYKGEKFGDESDYFLNYIDLLIKIGGGKQSIAEFKKAKKMGIKTKKYNLPERNKK